ncbi:MAG TPA: helix-turn-helix domain-containing protein [Woeseiaceae bacterium]|nr:helix-turn-helix domain-containing protein [Woeseiaceae bacterium]
MARKMIQNAVGTPVSRVPEGGRARAGVTCGDCGLLAMCLPHGLDRKARESFEQCVRRRRPLQRGEMLYVAGRPAHSVYALRCGSIKSFVVDPEGEEVVQAFYLPGEVLGLEGLVGDRHDHFAVALEPTLYCEIPAHALAELVPRHLPLQRQLMRIVNRQLGESRRQSFIYSRREARLRLATFLLELARRRAARRLSSTRFRLSMDRRDIASYLGLTLETVSRGFSRLQSEGLIESRGKAITLLQPRSLAALCGVGDHE